MKNEPIIKKIRRKLLHLRLQPIRVFCFHHTSNEFDECTMKHVDWLQTDEFKSIVEKLRKRNYKFISLPEAHQRLKCDKFRSHKYAVLTADDGWATLRNILPWLNEQQIPVTLFLNPAYLDGQHFRESEKEEYLTEYEVAHLYEQYPLLTIGPHGWEHVDAMKQTETEFHESVIRSNKYLKRLPNYIPFFAFTYGSYSRTHLKILSQEQLVPLLVRGGKNYQNVGCIDREVLDKNVE